MLDLNGNLGVEFSPVRLDLTKAQQSPARKPQIQSAIPPPTFAQLIYESSELCDAHTIAVEML